MLGLRKVDMGLKHPWVAGLREQLKHCWKTLFGGICWYFPPITRWWAMNKCGVFWSEPLQAISVAGSPSGSHSLGWHGEILLRPLPCFVSWWWDIKYWGEAGCVWFLEILSQFTSFSKCWTACVKDMYDKEEKPPGFLVSCPHRLLWAKKLLLK